MKSTTVDIFTAKARLSRLLDEVMQGRMVTITKKGKAVARLVPLENGSNKKINIKELLADFRTIRQRVGSRIKVKQWIEEGSKR